MRLSGLGQSCSPALSPENCVSAGGTYDDDNEQCVCAGSPAPGTLPSGFTPAQAQALCATSASGVWNPNTNSCDPVAGFANVSCANNTHPGTPSDVNCPWWCNLPPAELIFPACTPCSQTCPAGTAWDTTNNQCSSNPTTTNCSSGGAPPCPSYCGIPLLGGLIGGCPSACSSNTGSALAAVGAILLVYLGYKLLSK